MAASAAHSHPALMAGRPCPRSLAAQLPPPALLQPRVAAAASGPAALLAQAASIHESAPKAADAAPAGVQPPAEGEPRRRRQRRPPHVAPSTEQTQQGAAAAAEWPGLRAWRLRGVDSGRAWGERGPSSAGVHARLQPERYAHVPLAGSLVECAVQVLRTPCPFEKATLTHVAWASYVQGHLPLKPPELSSAHSREPGPAASQTAFEALPGRPARPDKPQLVAPKEVRHAKAPRVCMRQPARLEARRTRLPLGGRAEETGCCCWGVAALERRVAEGVATVCAGAQL